MPAVDKNDYDCDVALIGFGPTGAVLANLLGARGWRVVAFDRSLDVYQQPRAVHFDAEIMRVFQTLGLDSALADAITPVRGMHFVNEDGTLIFRFDADRANEPLGWPQGFMFYQPDLERVLRTGAARFPTVTARLGTEVTRVEVEPSGLGVLVEAVGPSGRHQLRARYAVGCCGAKSLTRAALGSALFDYGADQSWLVVDIILKDDVDLPVVTMQYCRPDRPCTYVMMPGARRRFEFMCLPTDDRADLVTPGRLAALLAEWMPADSYTVDRATIYTFHSLVAEQWRRGPLLIAGDAAHQMPPFLGQGMCAGVRDAANLAWKLDLVLSGVAQSTLLDTYQQERDRHVRRVIRADLYLGQLIQTTDREAARARDGQATAAGGPSTLTPEWYAIGDGLAPADAAAVGVPFPQPILDGRDRYDTRLGPGFALVGSVTPSPWAQSVLSRIGGRHVPDPPEILGRWLAAHDATAVLVRPDRIVLGLTRQADGLDTLLQPLAAHLSPAL